MLSTVIYTRLPEESGVQVRSTGLLSAAFVNIWWSGSQRLKCSWTRLSFRGDEKKEPSGAVLFTGFRTSENYRHLQATDPSSPIVQRAACSTTTQKVWSSSSILPESDGQFLKTHVWSFPDIGQLYQGIFPYCTVCPPILNISVVFSIVKTQGPTCQSVLGLSP